MQLFECKRFRKDYKLTQNQVADILGCNQSFIASIEKGTRPMPKEMISKLSSEYGDLTAYIISIEEPPQQVHQTNKNGDNINGQHVEVRSDSSKLIEVILQQSAQLSKSQEQIDRLISIIERK